MDGRRGTGVGEARGKKPAEMDHEAALLVLAPPKSNQACQGPRTCSLFGRPCPGRSGWSPARSSAGRTRPFMRP